MKKIVLATACVLSLAACENMNNNSGPTQQIRIITAPTGANCAIDRAGMTVDRVNGTPATAVVEKTGKDIVVRCIKSGYKQASATLKPKANKSYEDTVTLNLAKKTSVK